jgi:hypothetical protein
VLRILGSFYVEIVTVAGAENNHLKFPTLSTPSTYPYTCPNRTARYSVSPVKVLFVLRILIAIGSDFGSLIQIENSVLI